ncbi:MAG: trypsin-like peptidase domain-containing protein [Verrucomicrobiales bacterium]|nr:trypsin-like peptidase domain-containing protein [Verrucomicrobiales bacterium]
MTTSTVRFLFAIPFLLTLADSLPADEEMSKSVVDRVRTASVEVLIQGQLRGGGAFVKDSRGKLFILTAAHLFHTPRDTAVIATNDGKSYFASLSAYDLGHDLAILEVDPEAGHYGSLPLAVSIPNETEPVFNFGPALRRRTLVIPGHIADSRISYTDFTASKGYLAHYFVSAINPVMTSGGVWVNRSGEIVGIQHGRLLAEKGSSGLSMVSSPKAAAALLESNAIAQTPGLGGYIWEIWTADRSLLDELPRNAEGLFINPVFKNGPLARADLKQFDVIVSCDGIPVRRRHQLLEILRSKPAGSSFTFEVVSPGTQGRRPVALLTEPLEQNWK